MYIKKPECFKTFDQEYHVCRINRALYSIKQAPCAWYTRIDSYLTSLGFTKIEEDENVYHVLVEGTLLTIFLYVDDLIITGNDQLIISCNEGLSRDFLMKDMGLMQYLLGLKVWKGEEEFFVSQGKYANKILQRFCMDICKPMETSLATNLRKEDAISGEEVDDIVSRQLVGSIMYLVNTRTNMCYSFNQLNQAMVRPAILF